VIQEGDEEMHKDQTSWFPIEYNDDAIGTEARIWSNFRFRTRRPLPVQDKGYCEPAPECPNCKNNTMVWQEKDFYNHWVCHRAGCGKPVGKPKQEEMPLEKEINRIKLQETSVNHPISDAIRYLRDEIQKLK
jgi:hypothetical protein